MEKDPSAYVNPATKLEYNWFRTRF